MTDETNLRMWAVECAIKEIVVELNNLPGARVSPPNVRRFRSEMGLPSAATDVQKAKAAKMLAARIAVRSHG